MELIKLKKGAPVSDAVYKKISSPTYLYNALLYYMEKAGYTKPAMIGILCYVMNEGRPLGFYTYEGCYLNKGTDPDRKNPFAAGYKPVFDNAKWRKWLSVDTVNLLKSYGHNTLGLAGVGILSESDVWANGLNKPKTQTSCTEIIDAADKAGVDCHDPEFLCNWALKIIEATKFDKDYRDPHTFNGSAKEYAERVLCTVGMCGWVYGQSRAAAYQRYYSDSSVAAATKIYDAYKADMAKNGAKATTTTTTTTTKKDTATTTKKTTDVAMKELFVKRLPAISKGSKGDIVKVLQTELRRLGYYTGNIDGDAGNQTVAAIKKAQTNWNKVYKNVDVDGSFGPQCWTRLILGR